MAKASRTNDSAQKPPKARGGTVLGILLGLGLGLIIASIVAYFVYQKGTPFKTALENPSTPTLPNATPLKVPEPTAAAKSAAAAAAAANAAANAAAPAPTPREEKSSAPVKTPEPKVAEAKPVIEAKPADAKAAKAKDSPPAPQKEEMATGTEKGKPLFLQAGAFNGKEEAESRRIALLMVGLEAKITEITKDDKPIYRVRVGPFDSPESATKARGDMARNGIDSVLVK